MKVLGPTFAVAVATFSLPFGGLACTPEPELAADSAPVAQVALAESAADSGSGSGSATSSPSQTEDLPIEHIRVGDYVFDVRVAGPARGEVVILLHGFPLNSYQWLPQLHALAEAGYRVYAPDQRGYSPGARPAATEAYAITALAGDVTGLADAVGARRFHLVGHDWGGLVAWAVAQLAPTRLRSLSSLSFPHPWGYVSELTRAGSCQSRSLEYIEQVLAPNAVETLLAGDARVFRESLVALPAASAATYLALLKDKHALAAILKWYSANMVDGSPAGALPMPVVIPTLYMLGGDDPYNCEEPENWTRWLVWASYRYIRLPGQGHWLTELAPERVNSELLAHLGAHRARL